MFSFSFLSISFRRSDIPTNNPTTLPSSFQIALFGFEIGLQKWLQRMLVAVEFTALFTLTS